MNKFWLGGFSLSILGVVLILSSSCAMPLRVAQVAASTDKAPAGVRYWLRTPVFKPALWSNGKKNLSGIQFRLGQTFDGEPKLMEVSVSGSVAANTEVEITMDDDGALSSLISGEEDQTSQAIEAVVGLVTSAATGAPNALIDPAEDWAPLESLDPKLSKYVADQAAKKAEIEALVDALRRHRQSLQSASPSDFKALALTIDTLVETIDEQKSAWEANTFPLSRKRCHILEGEKRLYAEGDEPWITVHLVTDGTNKP